MKIFNKKTIIESISKYLRLSKRLFSNGILSFATTFVVVFSLLSILILSARPLPAGEMETPWENNKNPFTLTDNFILNNNLNGEDSSTTILELAGEDFTFTNTKTISDLYKLDSQNIALFDNQGSILNINGQLLLSDLTNSGTIAYIGEEDSGLSTAIQITGDLTNSGSISSLFGDIVISGNCTLLETGIMESVEGDIRITNELTNFGQISNGEQTVLSAHSISNSGVISQTGTVQSAGSLTNTANGLIEKVQEVTVGSDGLLNAGTVREVQHITGNVNNTGNMNSVNSVTGNVVNNGIISQGTGQNLMTITGQMTSGSEGTLVVGIDAVSGTPVPGQDNDQYQVHDDGTGSKTVIRGGTVQVKIRSGNEGQEFLRGLEHKYTFLTSENGFDFRFGDRIAIDANSDRVGLFSWSIGYNSESYYFWLDRVCKYEPNGRTWNEKQFGRYLDRTSSRVVEGSDYEKVLDSLDSLNTQSGVISEEAWQAVAQLDGAIYGSLRTMSVWNQTLVNQQLSNLLRPMSVSCPCCTEEARVKGKTWNFWGKYLGSVGSANYDGNAYGFDYSLAGIIVGGDMDFGDHARLGAWFSYVDSQIQMTGLDQRANILNYMYGLYFHKRTEYGYWLATASYSNDFYDVKRHIVFGSGENAINRTAMGDVNGKVGGLRLEHGLNFMTSHALIQPFGNIQFLHADTNEVLETGSQSTDLNIAAGNYSSLRTEFGSRFIINNNLMSSEKVNSRLMFQASWIHECNDSGDTIYATSRNDNLENFTANEEYTVRGVDLGRSWCNLGLGLDWTRGFLVFHGGCDFLFNDQQNLTTGNAGIAYGW